MGWEDIELMPTANLREELCCLLNKEVEYFIPPDGSDDADSFETIRRNVCQWNYDCVDYFLFDREVVYLSMHYFDKYLARQMMEHKTRPSIMLCHLLALSSLFVACKIHGVAAQSTPSNSSPAPRADLLLQDFCNMSRGAYCPQMLQEMELSLLTNLQWKVHPPTPTDFLIRFVKILSMSMNDNLSRQHNTVVDNVGKGWSVFEVARYQIELAVYSSELSLKFVPSKIALAATLNAIDSKIVKTKRPLISSRIRHSFLQQVYLEGYFTQLDVEGDDLIQARSMLKKLCSKTIVLPGQIVDDARPSDVTFTPIAAKSFEYELTEVKSASGSSISPVSVVADRF